MSIESQSTDEPELCVGQIWTPRRTNAKPKVIVKMGSGSTIYTARWPRVKSQYADCWTVSTDSRSQMRWWIGATDAELTGIVENPDA